MARRLSFLIVLTALLASGCGNSQKAKLIAQADPICKQVNTRRAAANAALGNVANLKSARTLSQVARMAAGIASFEHQAVVQLSALQAPSSLSQDWQTLLSGLQQLADNTIRLGAQAKAKNAKGGEKIITESRQIQKQLIALATHDHFRHCGRLS
jgi:hypothetical protein